MKTEEIIILERDDLIDEDKNINNIDLFCFKISKEPLITTGVILFIDNNGETKIIKNRYGDRGLCKRINKFRYE